MDLVPKTPDDQFRDAVAALERVDDPKRRAVLGHELQVAMKDEQREKAIRSIVDAAVVELRKTMSGAEVAALLEVSEQRISQMATGRHRVTPKSG